MNSEPSTEPRLEARASASISPVAAKPFTATLVQFLPDRHDADSTSEHRLAARRIIPVWPEMVGFAANCRVRRLRLPERQAEGAGAKEGRPASTAPADTGDLATPLLRPPLTRLSWASLKRAPIHADEADGFVEDVAREPWHWTYHGAPRS